MQVPCIIAHVDRWEKLFGPVWSMPFLATLSSSLGSGGY